MINFNLFKDILDTFTIYADKMLSTNKKITAEINNNKQKYFTILKYFSEGALF